MSAPTRQLIPTEDLKDLLCEKLDEILSRFFDLTGSYIKANRRFLLNSPRGDRHVGSFCVTISGPDRGRWADFAMSPLRGSRSAYATGDVFDLLSMGAHTANPADTFRLAREIVGLQTEDPASAREREARRLKREAEAEKARADKADQRKRRTKIAEGIWLSAQADVIGTPVDAYLKGRGIDLATLPHMPHAIRFHPACRYYFETGEEIADQRTGEIRKKTSWRPLPAMVTALHGRAGIMDCHRTYLEQVDGRWIKARLPEGDTKKVLLDYSGASARLCGERGPRDGHLRLAQAPEGSTVFIAEGVENALSLIALRALTGRKPAFVIAAGAVFNFARVDLPATVTRVVLAADNDSGDQARAQLDRAIEAHAALGREVRVWRSDVPGEDLNDRLQRALKEQQERGAA
jgi:hypothetical protein